MHLRYSPASPYARKVRVLALETRLHEVIDLIETRPADREAGFEAENPLGKVPSLLTDDGMALFDSPLICEYLDSAHGGTRMVPVATPGRWHVLRLQAVGDGIMDAAVAIMTNNRRPEDERSAGLVQRETDRIGVAADWLEAHAEELAGDFNLGQIAVACAFGYLDFRFPDLAWRPGRERLSRWYEEVCRRESMQQTAP